MGQCMCRDVKSHNESVLQSLEPGDLISIKRKGGVYSHWAMYMGNEMVIHLTGMEGHMASNANHSFSIAGEHFSKAVVQTAKFWDVVEDCKATKNNKKDKEYGTPKMSSDEIVNTAYKMAGMEVEYNVLLNNCEHFAHLWRYGEKKSEQADNAITVMLIAAGIVAGEIAGKVIAVIAGTVIKILAEK